MGSEHKVDGFDQPSRHKTSPSLLQVYVVLFCNDIDKCTEAGKTLCDFAKVIYEYQITEM